VTRDARLALTKDPGQLGHRKLTGCQHSHQAKPAWVSRGSKPPKELMQAERHNNANINKSLYYIQLSPSGPASSGIGVS
jgi:hypothetical protein